MSDLNEKELEMHLRKVIGNKIQKARLAADLTQEDVAEKAGISAQHLSSLETGYRRIHVTTLYRIAEAIGISLSHLFKIDEDSGSDEIIDDNLTNLIHEWDKKNRKKDATILLREFRQLTPEELRQLIETVKTLKKDK